MSDLHFKQCVIKAEKNVVDMDRVDGFKDRMLKTILGALECGLKRPETNAHYDAYIMLRDRVNQGDR